MGGRGPRGAARWAGWRPARLRPTPVPRTVAIDTPATTKGTTMGFLGKAIKSGVAMKVGSMILREAQKPANQRKAKELLAKARSRKA